MSFYAVTYAELRVAVRPLGYALGLHGSLRKDLDLIAIPWTEDAADEKSLVDVVCKTAGGLVLKKDKDDSFGLKPHGRHAYTIILGGCSAMLPPDEFATYIDLSVMPRK